MKFKEVKMYSFANDYSEGACPQVMQALQDTNYIQTVGYGLDEYCLSAAKQIKKLCDCPDGDVHFIPGGTPANALGMSLLKPYEAIISCDSGHINIHETGAVEASGHKIIAVKAQNGKITVPEIEKVLKSHTDEHMVKPKMVFISNSTELGTIYTKKELTAISDYCHANNLYLYLDGARLSNALVAKNNDLSLKDIAELTDIFYLGATKNGALLGEAMLISNDDLKPDFRYLLKQKGSMLAKARIIGIEFLALLNDDVYLKNAKNANVMAQTLSYIFKHLGIEMFVESPTNQIFPIIDNRLLKKLEEKYLLTVWNAYDEQHTVVRFVCSWATKKTDIENFYNDLLQAIAELERTE